MDWPLSRPGVVPPPRRLIAVALEDREGDMHRSGAYTRSHAPRGSVVCDALRRLLFELSEAMRNWV